MAPTDLPLVLQIIPYVLLLVILASYATTILNERPTAVNADRMATRLRGRSWRGSGDPVATVDRKRRVVRPAAITLAIFALLALALAAAITVLDVIDYGSGFFGLALARDLLLLATAGGLLPVAAAYYFWAPRLLERVRELLEPPTATAKEDEPFSDARDP
ncbi:MAG: hypothetical protein HYT80_04125 [Euryarchaeota archaeon]|nr:hypothetical protein [Euryarchaeota archaeon]